MRILMVSSEVAGFARTGGLGDAVRGLADALATKGEEILLVAPRYGITSLDGEVESFSTLVCKMGDAEVTFGALCVRTASGARVLLVEHGSFDRPGIYGDAHGEYGDNHWRFALLGSAALAAGDAYFGAWKTDVLHAHDWQGSFAILALRSHREERKKTPRTLLTIHNLAYQGETDFEKFQSLGFTHEFARSSSVEHFGKVNLLKAACNFADAVTTVSERYAKEVLVEAFGCGLDGFLSSIRSKFIGIQNGIDQASYDPSCDRALFATYDAASAEVGKRENKNNLCRELGIRSEGPLFGMVSRLTWQKGIDQCLDHAKEIVAAGASLVIVGVGEHDLEARALSVAKSHPGRVAFVRAFDDTLARRVFAASDFFVVPSRFEPCGLVQMYAMRYGAIPIVSRVGGLVDSVEPLSAMYQLGTGWVVDSSESAWRLAFRDAQALYKEPEFMASTASRAMNEDFSWAHAATEYLERAYTSHVR